MINLNSKAQAPVENGGKQQQQQQNGFHEKMTSAKKLKKTANDEKPVGKTTASASQKGQDKSSPAPTGAAKYDPKMLESFWKLSEYSFETRRDGIKQISEYFGKLDAETNKDAYNYILMRLVRGLASNRKCSRLGFSSALTELLLRYPSLKFEKVLEVADKNLNTPIDAQNQAPSNKKANTEEAILDNLAIMSKEELRHMQIGVVFVYFCWIESNRLDQFAEDQQPSKQNLKLLDTILQKLNEMRRSNNKEIKEYIQQLYLSAFIMIAKKLIQINKRLFEDKVLPLIRDELVSFSKYFDEGQQQESNAETSLQLRDTLHILLACLNASTNATSSIDVINKAKQLIFKPSNHNQLYEFISKSSELLPNLHPFCIELIEYGVHGTSLEAIGSKQQRKFTEFWLNVIDGKLLQRREPEKKLLGYKLYLIGLKHLNEANYEQLFNQCFLASNNLQKTLVNNLVLKASNLNELINKSYIKEFVEQISLNEAKFKTGSSSLTFGADLIIKLINFGQRNIHDLSELVGSVILQLNEKSLSKFFDYLIEEYNTCSIESSKLSSTNENTDGVEEKNLQLASIQMRKLWVVNQFTNLSKNAALFENSDLVNNLVSNIVTNCFFEKLPSAPETKKSSKKTKAANDDENVSKTERFKLLATTDSKSILQLRDSLFKYYGLLINKNEHKMNSIIVNSLKQIESLLGKCVTDNDERASRKQADLIALCSRMLKLVEKMNKLFKKEEEAASKNSSHDPEKSANKDVLQTFFMIISFESLKMFESLRDSKKIIDDIEICYENFQDEYKSDKKSSEAKVVVGDEDINPDEIKWIDFLVEMLLNLLPINNSWIRNTVKIQFRKLFPKLTFNSIKLIIDMIEPNSETNLLMEVDEEDDGLSDEDDADEEDEDDDEVDEAAKKVNKIKLGKKKKNQEEDDDESEDEEKSSSSKKKRKRSSKDEDEDEDDESSSSDEEDDDEDEDDPNAPAHDTELREALLKALGEAGVVDDGNDSGPDLDDEAMLKLDETLAQAFRVRKKTKSNQMDAIQIKLRALDLIQELFKTTYRLDLIAYSIKPMLDILFESQKKPNLKNISQRILGFLVNLKNTTKKLNDSKFPSVDEIFTLLNHIIKCSTIHFNVTNTLVEASMFCVRLIQHLANANKSESEKTKTLNRLNEIYLEIIKNFYTSPASVADQNNNSNKKSAKNNTQPPVENASGKINPSMYKEYLLRYPAYSNKLALKMIELASLPDVKLHKKTVTLITLQQTINNQMFNELKQDLIDEFMEKIFIFFNKIIDEIMQDENIHIKFLDAFLSLVAKVLNLKKNFIKEALIENLVKKLTQFVKESKAKQAFKNRCTNLIQTCHGYLKKN